MFYMVTDTKKKMSSVPLIAKIKECSSQFLTDIKSLNRLQIHLNSLSSKTKPKGTLPEMKANGHFVLVDTKKISSQ